MGIRFKNGVHSLEKQMFSAPKEREQVDNPVANWGAAVISELQRVGWEVPGLDVEFVSKLTPDGIRRKVGAIMGKTSKGPWQILFDDGEQQFDLLRLDVSEVATPPGYRFAFGHDLDHRLRVAKQRYEGGDWFGEGEAFLARMPSYEPERRPDDRIRHCQAFLGELLQKLTVMPSATGHDDATEEGDANLRRLAHVERIPAPAGFPNLYTWMTSHDVTSTARQGAVVPGDGYRLSARSYDAVGKLPDNAWLGYSYAGTVAEARPGHCVHGGDEFDAPVEIVLASLNDVWVVDNSVLAKRRAQILSSTGQDRLTDSQLDDCIAAVARTMIPAADYAGGYETPVYAIGRRLLSDEARILRGPVEVREDEDGVSVRVEDASTGPVLLFQGGSHRSDLTHAKEIASRVGYLMNGSHSWRHRVAKPAEESSAPAP